MHSFRILFLIARPCWRIYIYHHHPTGLSVSWCPDVLLKEKVKVKREFCKSWLMVFSFPEGNIYFHDTREVLSVACSLHGLLTSNERDFYWGFVVWLMKTSSPEGNIYFDYTRTGSSVSYYTHGFLSSIDRDFCWTNVKVFRFCLMIYSFPDGNIYFYDMR